MFFIGFFFFRNMRAVVVAMVLCLICSGIRVNAWGGLFNRFSPEMLANMGYGAHGGFAQPFVQVCISECLQQILLFFVFPYRHSENYGT